MAILISGQPLLLLWILWTFPSWTQVQKILKFPEVTIAKAKLGLKHWLHAPQMKGIIHQDRNENNS